MHDLSADQNPLSEFGSLSIAAIVPCYNEAGAIGKVVHDLRAAVPQIVVYVYDNNSTDGTAGQASEAGAIVRREDRRGKGNVVRRAFADIDADVYVMIDGDDTYDVAALPGMINKLLEGPYDHVLGCRQDDPDASKYRPGHARGNAMFNKFVSRVFRDPVSDMLSGYRVFSRRFVKSFTATSREFEIETELTVHISSLRTPSVEYPVGFSDRAEGTESKLNTFSDGFKILGLIIHLIRHERPVFFYGIGAFICAMVAVLIGIPVVAEFAETGLVPRLPSALLATGLALIAVVLWMIGQIMAGIKRNRDDAARLRYLEYPAVSCSGD